MKRYLGIVFALVLAVSLLMVPAAVSAAVTTHIQEGNQISVESVHSWTGEETKEAFDSEAHLTVVDTVAFDAQSGPVTIEGEISGLALGPGWVDTAYVEIGVRPKATMNERNAGVYFIIFTSWDLYCADISDYTGQKVGNKVENIPISDSFSYKITLNPNTATGIGGTADLALWNAVGFQEVDITDFPYGYASSWKEEAQGSLNEDYSEAYLFYSIIADRRGVAGVTYSATVGDVTANVYPPGALEMTATYTPAIGISVNPPFIDFGAVSPGAASALQTVTVTNEGNAIADFDASIIHESVAGVYTTGLKMGGDLVSAWGSTGVAVGDSVSPGLILTVPDLTPPGTYRATIIFWAMAAPQ